MTGRPGLLELVLYQIFVFVHVSKSTLSVPVNLFGLELPLLVNILLVVELTKYYNLEVKTTE
jgi:hypothetical protein